MRKTADQPLWYRGEFDTESLCHCRVYRPDAEERAAGRLADVEDNPGSPVLLAGDALVVRLWKKLKQPEGFVLLVVHSDGDVSEVLFQVGAASTPFLRPGRVLCEADTLSWAWHWSKMSAKEMEALIDSLA